MIPWTLDPGEIDPASGPSVFECCAPQTAESACISCVRGAPQSYAIAFSWLAQLPARVLSCVAWRGETPRPGIGNERNNKRSRRKWPGSANSKNYSKRRVGSSLPAPRLDRPGRPVQPMLPAGQPNRSQTAWRGCRPAEPAARDKERCLAGTRMQISPLPSGKVVCYAVNSWQCLAQQLGHVQRSQS